MVLHHAGKSIVHHKIAPGSLGEVALEGCFDTTEWAHSLGWEATPHMNGCRVLNFWHDTGLMEAITFCSPDNHFSRCPKQSEGGFRENNFTTVLCSPIPLLPVECQSVIDVFLGEKWLLCCPYWHQHILQKSSAHCACRSTYTSLLPFLSKLCTGDDPIP